MSDDTKPDALEALARQADQAATPAPAGDDAPGAPGAPGAAPAVPEPGNFEAIAFMLAGFREVAGAMLGVQSLRRTLADDKVETCARVLVPVADKYGLNLGGYLGGPEAAAVMVAGPILWTAWRELAAELADKRRTEQRKPEAEAPPPAAVVVEPGPATDGQA